MAEQDIIKQPDIQESKPKEDVPEVRRELSKLASNPKQNILILTIIIAIIIYLIFNFFINSKDQKVVESHVDPLLITKSTLNHNSNNNIDNIPKIPQLPDPPQLIVPPSAPKPVPLLPKNDQENNNEIRSDVATISHSTNTANSHNDVSKIPNLVDDIGNDEEKRRKEAKRKASIVLIAGVEQKKSSEQIAKEADFQLRGNLELVLGRGKIISAVLETAINSDFGGELRAVISRDVFSESGKNILIAKGSRVFGVYKTGVDGAYGRISIEWNRIDLASGYSLHLRGTGVDSLGRAGTQGRVDNKFTERFTNAVLTSAFNIGLAKGLDAMVAPITNSQLVAQNTASATELTNLALAIFKDPTKRDAEKIPLICAGVSNAIIDKTSTSYITFVAACASLNVSTGATDAQKLTSLMTSVNAASSSILTSAATAAVATQSQNASKQAFTDLTNLARDMATEHKFTPTVTIDQGTLIKIYVNQDYTFPKAALSKFRLVK